jgi:hypothetical protein
VGGDPGAAGLRSGEDRAVHDGMMRKLLALLAAASTLAACNQKGTLERSQVHYVTVEGRRYEVRVAPTDVPNEYRLFIVRATLVIDPDAAAERERDSNVARRVMDRVCKGRYQTIDDMLVAEVNFYARFRCQA